MTLRLASETPRLPPNPFEAPPFSLEKQPQRPGDLCVSLVVELASSDLDEARRRADDAQLPLGLWLVVAIEAERALAAAQAATGIARARIEVAAEAVADMRSPHDIAPYQVRRLRSYADAVRGGTEPRPSEPGRAIALRVPHLLAAAWSLAAAAERKPVDAWAAGVPLAPGRERWEAAAAEAALQLSEWVLLQAARLARSTSA